MGFIQNAKNLIAQNGDEVVAKRTLLGVLDLSLTGRITITAAQRKQLKDVVEAIGDAKVDGAMVKAVVTEAKKIYALNTTAVSEINSAYDAFRDQAPLDPTRETDHKYLVMSVANAMLDKLIHFDRAI